MRFNQKQSFGRTSLRFKKTWLTLAFLGVFALYFFGIMAKLFEIDYSLFSYPLDIPMDDVLAAMKSGKPPPVIPINIFKYAYRISNNQKCLLGNNGGHETVNLLIMIKSALPNRESRDLIRKTWGSEDQFPELEIRRIFLLGNSSNPGLQNTIDHEQFEYEDIVQADFIDSYYNNTIKTTLGFKWVFEHCPKAEFIFFTDDDYYVSTKNLLTFIQSLVENREVPMQKHEGKTDSEPSHRNKKFMAGFVSVTFPIRDQSSKFYIPVKDYPYSMYPPFINAGAYVLSFSALEDMFYTFMFTKPFKFDDVYLAIVAKKCGITLVHSRLFIKDPVSYDRDAFGEVIACHGFEDPEERRRIWEEQKSLRHA